MAKSVSAVTWMLPALALGLSACGGGDKAAEGSPEKTATPAKAAAAPAAAPSGLNLAAGPDVCFKAIAKHLGADAKVAEITSFFAEGADIEGGSSDEPVGTMTTCKVPMIRASWSAFRWIPKPVYFLNRSRWKSLSWAMPHRSG
jgi:hypothetical protein